MELIMKLTRRKGFNFYRSYYDVFNKLPTDRDKLEFISILLDKQFLDADPVNCSMIVEFAYESQLHSITKQVKGWKDATSLEITDPQSTPQGVGAPIPPIGTPMQVKEKEKEKEKTKDTFTIFWNQYHNITGLPKTDREPAKKYWNRLKIEEQRKAYESIKPYFDSLPIYSTGKPLKKARTYLADKNYEDEFAGATNTTKKIGNYIELTEKEKEVQHVNTNYTYIHFEKTYKKVHSDDKGNYIEKGRERIYL